MQALLFSGFQTKSYQVKNHDNGSRTIKVKVTCDDKPNDIFHRYASRYELKGATITANMHQTTQSGEDFEVGDLEIWGHYPKARTKDVFEFGISGDLLDEHERLDSTIDELNIPAGLKADLKTASLTTLFPPVGRDFLDNIRYVVDETGHKHFVRLIDHPPKR